MKRRSTTVDGEAAEAGAWPSGFDGQSDSTNSAQTVAQKLDSLPQMVQGLYTGTPDVQLQATRHFRKLLSIEKMPPIEDVIRAGVVPKFVEFLMRNDLPDLQFEAAWALTNIASGTSENTRVVIDHGAIPIFVQLLSSEAEDVREQAIWALGNIAGDSAKCRDLVLENNVMAPLLGQLHEHSKTTMLRNATWTLSNLCRGKPQPMFQNVRVALPYLGKLIHYSDEEVLTDACWALSYLSDGTNDKIEAVIQSGVVPRLIELLSHNTSNVLVPALRTVGNIVTGNDNQTQTVIEAGALQQLLQLLIEPVHKKSIRKEACWTISNITAGNQEQIQAVMNAGIIPPIVNLLANAEFDIKKEAAWAISNATSGGNGEQIKKLVEWECIKPLCDLLACSDAKIITVALEGLENILRVGHAMTQFPAGMAPSGMTNPYAELVDHAEGLDKIENLQSHSHHDIYKKVVDILEKYFGTEGVQEDEHIAPAVDMNAGQYSFGQQQMAPQGGFNFAPQ